MTTTRPDLARGGILPRGRHYPFDRPAPLLREIQAAIEAMLRPVRSIRQQHREKRREI